jgi:hypothetical protein
MDLHAIAPYLAAGAASFLSVFLKGFQHRNVNGNHLRLVFVTSYAMALMDVAVVGIIVKGGWAIAIPSGTGAACGMVLSMKFHDRLFKRKVKPNGR